MPGVVDALHHRADENDKRKTRAADKRKTDQIKGVEHAIKNRNKRS
jgi:hypothetical protein